MFGGGRVEQGFGVCFSFDIQGLSGKNAGGFPKPYTLNPSGGPRGSDIHFLQLRGGGFPKVGVPFKGFIGVI